MPSDTDFGRGVCVLVYIYSKDYVTVFAKPLPRGSIYTTTYIFLPIRVYFNAKKIRETHSLYIDLYKIVKPHINKGLDMYIYAVNA